MAKRAGRSLQGISRVSKSLGASDPRSHRNPQAIQDQELIADLPIEIVGGRLRVRKGRAVTDLPTGASQADVVTKMNQLLSSLRAAGLLEI